MAPCDFEAYLTDSVQAVLSQVPEPVQEAVSHKPFCFEVLLHEVSVETMALAEEFLYFVDGEGQLFDLRFA